ncbi:MAG: hypothetical protein F6K48_33130 [Okeania sp. SIO3H1]|nr:hypothetical protein [Okeania sp. SIO3H1]
MRNDGGVSPQESGVNPPLAPPRRGKRRRNQEEKEKVFWSRERNGVLSLIIRT